MFLNVIDWSIFENFDWKIFQFAENIKCGFLDYFLGAISWLGDFAILWIILGLAMLFFKKTRKTGIVLLLSLIIVSIVANLWLKPLFDRPRPFDYIWKNGIIFNDEFYRPSFLKIPGSLSFPSGHTSVAFAPAFVIYFYQKHKWGIPAIVFAFLTGFSRIYVHDHYPTDVIGGIITGIACGLIAILIEKLICNVMVPYIKSKSKK